MLTIGEYGRGWEMLRFGRGGRMGPMYFCLTFDDGLKVHHDVVAPLLARYGWKGTFSIPTDFITSKEHPLNADQLRDCCLEGHKDNLMNVSDVKQLFAEGHEIVPHSCSHVDLKALERLGDVEAIRREIFESKRWMHKYLGVAPKFFCSPHNSLSPLIVRLIHKNGMEAIGCDRVNYGEIHPNETQLPIDSYIQQQYKRGVLCLSVMIHGVERARGGWRPFEKASDFEDFLKRVNSVVQQGIIRVVTYSEGHRALSALSPVLKRVDRWHMWMRRGVFRLLDCVAVV